MNVAVVCLAALTFSSVFGQDGTSPTEICPCQLTSSCQEDRHIYGTDSLDIEKFGLISACQQTGHVSCCPKDPPPAKKFKLTAKDFEGFSTNELIEAGVLNGTAPENLPLSIKAQLGLIPSPIFRHQVLGIKKNNPGQPVAPVQPAAAQVQPAAALSVPGISEAPTMTTVASNPLSYLTRGLPGGENSFIARALYKLPLFKLATMPAYPNIKQNYVSPPIFWTCALSRLFFAFPIVNVGQRNYHEAIMNGIENENWKAYIILNNLVLALGKCWNKKNTLRIVLSNDLENVIIICIIVLYFINQVYCFV